MAVKHFNPVILGRVKCPPDMGQPGYTGRIVAIDPKESSHMLRAFRWITVERLNDDGRPTGQKSVWPSTRLTAI